MNNGKRDQGRDKDRGGGQRGNRPFLEFFVSGTRRETILTVRLTYNNRPPNTEKVITFWLGTEEDPYQEILLSPDNPENSLGLFPNQSSALVRSKPLDLTAYDQNFTRITTESEGLKPMWKPLPASLPKEVGSLRKSKGDKLQVDTDVDEDASGKFFIRVSTQGDDGKPGPRPLIARCDEVWELESTDTSVALQIKIPRREYHFRTPNSGYLVLGASFVGIKRHPTVESPETHEIKTIDLVKFRGEKE